MCNVVDIFVQGVYVSNVECVYTSISGHIVDYSEFI